jgi:hypothetical protein
VLLPPFGIYVLYKFKTVFRLFFDYRNVMYTLCRIIKF